MLLRTICSQLPSLAERLVSTALQDTTNTRLGRAVSALMQAHPGRSGIVPLPDGRDAFAARALLADGAQRSLDVQYYIWRDDLSGTLLFDALRGAADRGVRVRLLLDDHNTVGLDAILASLDAHPNIEVRLFNPFAQRRWRWLGFLGDFARLNRRMHNKSFTADNQVTIVGGRNVGDEYFGADEDLQFVDLDVLAVGSVVISVSNDFDRYWASQSAYPARALLLREPGAVAAAAERLAQVKSDPAAHAYVPALSDSPHVHRMLTGDLDFEWTSVRVVSDDPAKALGLAPPEGLLLQRLKDVLGTPRRDLRLVSPYFVPTASGVEAFGDLVRGGVEVMVLTNSLAATDVAAVHAGYAKRRKPLLEAGVELFELKRAATVPTGGAFRIRGSSAASLHAKTFAVDHERVFVGSFNLDPRSARLNTELGFVIDSPRLALALADWFAVVTRNHAYEVRLSDDGALNWLDCEIGEAHIYREEPGIGFWRRAGVGVLSWLPIEWLL